MWATSSPPPLELTHWNWHCRRNHKRHFFHIYPPFLSPTPPSTTDPFWPLTVTSSYSFAGYNKSTWCPINLSKKGISCCKCVPGLAQPWCSQLCNKHKADQVLIINNVVSAKNITSTWFHPSAFSVSRKLRQFRIGWHHGKFMPDSHMDTALLG